MSYIGLLLFLIVNIIRPQDWYAPLLGLPVMNLLFCFILLGIFLFPSKPEAGHNHICLGFIAGYIATVFWSSLINVNLVYALEVTANVSKIAFYFLAPILIVFSTKRAKVILLVILVLISCVSLEIISVAWGGEGLAGQVRLQGSYYEKEIRIPWVGLWNGPNVVAVLLLIGSSISLVSFFNSRMTAFKILYALNSFILLVSIYYTGSRGAILTIPVSIVVYLILMKKTRWLIATGIIVITLGCYFYQPERGLSTKESSAHERVLLWEKGLIDLRYHGPLFGIGYGRFINNEFKLIAHSNYVQTFSELGLIGFFFFTAPFYVVIRRMYTLSTMPDEYGFDVAYIAQAILLSLIAISVSTIFVVMNYEIMYFLLGMGVACEKFSEKKSASGFIFTKRDFVVVLTVMTFILSLYYALSIHRVA